MLVDRCSLWDHIQEEREVTSGKGSTAHFVWRCGLCKREHSAKFDPGEKPKPYSADANGQFASFLTIDCRGLEFVGFDPKEGALAIRKLLQMLKFLLRASGNASVQSLAPRSQKSTLKRASGSTTTRRRVVAINDIYPANICE